MVKWKIIALFTASISLLGCGGINLVDIQKSSSELQLTNKQILSIEPKLKLIRDIVDDYEFERRQLDGDLREYRILANDRGLYRYDGGLSTQQRRRGLTQIRTKVRKFITQRNLLLKEIEKLIIEIHNELTEEQRVTFAKLKIPELKIPRSLKRDPHADFKHLPSHLIGVR